MKKSLRLIVFTAIAAMLCFSSCTKDPEKLIVGKWKVVSARCSDQYFGDAVENDKGTTWNFKENGTFTGTMNIMDFIGSDISCNYTCDDSSLELRGGDLKGTFDGESYNIVYMFDIDEISRKELSISGKVKISDTYDGYTDTYSFSVSYDLEKK